MSHNYNETCKCIYCERERSRRAQEPPTTFDIMAENVHSKNRRRAKNAREFWDAYESGAPMSSDDY